MRILLALCALGAALPAAAQATWTKCADENGTCTLAAQKLVRYGQPFTPAGVGTWTAPRTMVGTFRCDNTTFTDPSPGTGKQCQTLDVPVAPGAPTAAWSGAMALAWDAPQAYTDGTALRVPLTYRVTIDGAPVATVPGLTYSASGLAAGEHCATVAAIAGDQVSEDPAPVCKVVAPPPSGPVVVPVVPGLGDSPVYSITAAGGRGAAVVGFARVGATCSGAVVYRYRGASYRRVDPAAIRWWQTGPTTNAAAACN